MARFWRSNAAERDFERFGRQGTVLASDGALELDASAPVGTSPFPAGGAAGTPPIEHYRLGSASLSEQAISGGFDSAIPSFDALTPPGTWVRVTLAARVEGTWTKDYDFGPWALDKSTVSRRSVDGQEDSQGRVLTDTLVLKRKADALRATVWLYSTQPGVSPRVRALSVALSDGTRMPVDSLSDQTGWGTVLDVPGLSQMPYPNGGPVWCSPTSTTMLLGYWNRKLGRNDLAEPVPTAAEHVYDEVYRGTGNWSFNTAYAAARGDGALHGAVVRLDGFAQVGRFIAAGIPVSISIAYTPGMLTGSAAYSSDGHLIVVKGFTPQGDVVCNDPAFPSDEKVGVTYKRAELWQAWRHSGGAAYVLWPTGTALPSGSVSLVP
ncbi:peptidase C39 family protein [Stigmatella sp. ncwal1]|uniref:Peptidase C39 family protein n=1 Tax=Stigmatella ashevillensis TaxID=2995309 RepID=A0ABT5DFV6_9BACT|nr:peptidase C39 family protein [Stigmatella ashevillena]MDC0712493.1 peptidase C39 family protein [Stigmatella ashevillena]